MKILTLHCDYIKFKPLKKAIKAPEELETKEEQNIEEPLVILTAIEKEDTPATISQLVNAVKTTAGEVKAKALVLYPYAHLSSNLASPEIALNYLKEAAEALKKEGFNVIRAPFGYYKSFELKCKGHPLSELSKEFKTEDKAPSKGHGSFSKKGKGEVEHIDENERLQLVKRLSKTTMQATRGKNNLKSNVELGKELDLYMVSEVIGQGLPLLTPKGTTIKRIIERFITDEEIKRGYEHTATPFMAKSDLYKISGHWEHYKDGMFVLQDGEETLALRPMTCPFQFTLFKRKLRSYKDLPKKYAEISTLFRKEQSGELRGLTRVRQFTLADAHIICKPDQLEKEFEEVIDLINYVMKSLGIKDIWYRFSKWDPKDKSKYIDAPEAWAESQSTMKKILDKLKIKYKEAEGEAAFYGPKLDIQYEDVYGKEDTLITVQIDFALPERFDLTYVDSDGKEKRPMVIHRSSSGATERVLAYLLEKTQGALPLWLSPIQVRVINFTDRNIIASEKIIRQLKEAMPQLRIDSDFRNTTLSDKVRDAELQKVPISIVIGEKEEKSKTLAIRERGQKPKFNVKLDDFVKDLEERIEKSS